MAGLVLDSAGNAYGFEQRGAFGLHGKVLGAIARPRFHTVLVPSYE